MNQALIERLARLRGIGEAYHDYRGELQYFTAETRIALLRAMDGGMKDEAALELQVREMEAVRAGRLRPPLAVFRTSRILLELNVSARDFGGSLIWDLCMEDGTRHQGVASTSAMRETWRGEVDGSWMTRRQFELPHSLPFGLHDLRARVAGGLECQCRLVVAPMRCHLPPDIASGRHCWGVAVQLYAVRSGQNWGIGDFRDLMDLLRWAAARGADFVALNPLHALAPADPERCSPYSASSRLFLNVLYISVPLVEDFMEATRCAGHPDDEESAARLAQLRSGSHVNYRGVASLKLDVLSTLYRSFRTRHPDSGEERARRFQTFVDQGGEALRLHALFDALDEHFAATRGSVPGWQNWPAEFASPASDAVARFARDHAERIGFFQYLQWLAHEQLRQCQELARSLGMRIGLYGDLAVGAHPGGSEVWSAREIFRLGAEIGAPPDPLALKGQGWGLPPQDPQALVHARLGPFVDLMNANMRHFGALRIDHVMALFRQWWVPVGQSPETGAYVHYPLAESMAVLSLISERRRCLVVGEDLGVVPDEIRSAMTEHGLLHYKVLLFEKEGERFRLPREYEPLALATACTHDMPTLCSYWEGRDIDLRNKLNLYPSESIRDAVLSAREHDRFALLDALRAEGLSPAKPRDTIEPFDPALATAVHEYLARSASILVALQLDDLLGMADPVNVPGTFWEYPNWKRKLSATVEQITQRADLDLALARVEAARRGNRFQ